MSTNYEQYREDMARLFCQAEIGLSLCELLAEPGPPAEALAALPEGTGGPLDGARAVWDYLRTLVFEPEEEGAFTPEDYEQRKTEPAPSVPLVGDEVCITLSLLRPGQIVGSVTVPEGALSPRLQLIYAIPKGESGVFQYVEVEESESQKKNGGAFVYNPDAPIPLVPFEEEDDHGA